MDRYEGNRGRAKAKYHVIGLHREDYPISVICSFFKDSRSGCYDFVCRVGRPEPDAGLRQMLQERQVYVRQTCGYRQIQLWLESQGIHHNPKTVFAGHEAE